MTQLMSSPPAVRRPRPVLTALIVLTGVFLSSLDLFIVNIAFPSISATIHGESLSSLSWVLSAYTIVFAAVLVPAGRWADRAGRKRAFLLGLAIFTTASALCAVSPSLGFLIGARVLQAIGGALMLPTSLGLLLPAFGPERKGAAIGLWSAVGGAAAALGPPIGGLLVQASWRWVFLVNLPFAVLALVLGVRTLARGPRPRRPQVRPPRSALLTVRWPAWSPPSSRARTGVGPVHGSSAPSRWPSPPAPGWSCAPPPPQPDHRAGRDPPPRRCAGRSQLARLLRRLRGPRARWRPVPHRPLARVGAAGRVHDRSGPVAGRDHRVPGRAPGRPLRAPGRWHRRRAALRRRGALVDHPRRRGARLGGRLPAGQPAQWHRCRAHAPLARRRRHRTPAPRALRHRFCALRHEPPDRHRARRRRASSPFSAPPRVPRRHRLPPRLGLHDGLRLVAGAAAAGHRQQGHRGGRRLAAGRAARAAAGAGARAGLGPCDASTASRRASRRDSPPATGRGPTRRAPAQSTPTPRRARPTAARPPGRRRRARRARPGAPRGLRRSRAEPELTFDDPQARCAPRRPRSGRRPRCAPRTPSRYSPTASTSSAAVGRPNGDVGPSAATGPAGAGGGVPKRPKRSHSLSQTRRPMAASSTERAAPLRWADACRAQMVAHLTVA